MRKLCVFRQKNAQKTNDEDLPCSAKGSRIDLRWSGHVGLWLDWPRNEVIFSMAFRCHFVRDAQSAFLVHIPASLALEIAASKQMAFDRCLCSRTASKSSQESAISIEKEKGMPREAMSKEGGAKRQGRA